MKKIIALLSIFLLIPIAKAARTADISMTATVSPYISITWNYNSVAWGALSHNTANNTAPNQANGIYNVTVDTNQNFKLDGNGTNPTGGSYSFDVGNMTMDSALADGNYTYGYDGIPIYEPAAWSAYGYITSPYVGKLTERWLWQELNGDNDYTSMKLHIHQRIGTPETKNYIYDFKICPTTETYGVNGSTCSGSVTTLINDYNISQWGANEYFWQDLTLDNTFSTTNGTKYLLYTEWVSGITGSNSYWNQYLNDKPTNVPFVKFYETFYDSTRIDYTSYRPSWDFIAEGNISISLDNGIPLMNSPQTIDMNIPYTTTTHYHGYWLSIPNQQYATDYSFIVTLAYSNV